MTRDEAVELLRSTLVTMTGISDSLILLGDLDMVRPSDDHAFIRIRTDEVVSWPGIDDADDLSEVHRLRIELEVIGWTVVPWFKRACARLRLRDDPDGYDLSRAGVAIESIDRWTNVAAAFRNAPEPRELTTITITYKQTDTPAVPVVVTEITVDAESDEGLAYTETFPIPPTP